MKNLTAFEKIILLLLLIATLIFLYVQFFKKPKTNESSKQEPGASSPGSERKSSGNSQQPTISVSMEKEWTTLLPSLIQQAQFKDNRIVNILSQFEHPAVKKVIIDRAIEENKTLEQEILECAMHILRHTMPKNTNTGGGQQPKMKKGTTIEWADDPGDTPK